MSIMATHAQIKPIIGEATLTHVSVCPMSRLFVVCRIICGKSSNTTKNSQFIDQTMPLVYFSSSGCSLMRKWSQYIIQNTENLYPTDELLHRQHVASAAMRIGRNQKNTQR